MKQEVWTVQGRDRDGNLLAETRILWEPGVGMVSAETERTAPPETWEALRAELRRSLEELPE